MNIGENTLAFSASHSLQRQETVRETLAIRRNGIRPANSAPAPKVNDCHCEKSDNSLDNEALLLKRIIEKLFGRFVEVLSSEAFLERLEHEARRGKQLENDIRQAETEANVSVRHTRERHYLESEQTRFQASLEVRDEQGNVRKLEISFNLQRRFESFERFSMLMGEAVKDPLVVNLGSGTAQLGGGTVQLDLDLDGKVDVFSGFRSDSGFLALDKNTDGKINDGSELFGALSGDGFSDLAAYDDNQDGWITELDYVFRHLLVWKPGEEGGGNMLSLADAGIDAIGLQAQATPYEYRDSGNVLLGKLVSTAVTVRDDFNSLGTIQQLDLAVKA